MKNSILLLAILFTTAAVSGFTAPEIPEDPSEEQIDRYVDIYNNNTDKVPGFVGSLVGDQDINLDYEDNSYGVGMTDLKIDEVREPFNKSTVNIWIEREDVVEIANATSPKQELREKLDNGEIRYEEKGIVNKVKFSLFRLFL